MLVYINNIDNHLQYVLNNKEILFKKLQICKDNMKEEINYYQNIESYMYKMLVIVKYYNKSNKIQINKIIVFLKNKKLLKI